MVLDASALLAGPRGRHLCLAVAVRVHRPVWSAWLEAAWHPSDPVRRQRLLTTLADAPAGPVERWDRPALLLDPMDETVSAAMGWQEPRDEDVVAADPDVVALLRPIADALSRAPAARWWATGLDLGAIRGTERYDERFPARGLRLDGVPARLADLRAEEDEQDRRARTERPDDPRAPWTGRWWSTPAFAAVPTTRALPGVGSVNLLWEEDSFGQWDALVTPLRTTGPVRILEIDGPAAWIGLVRRYPQDVTWSRRQDWYRVTGRDGPWLIPDWAAVACDFDAVHLSVLGYLATATRLLDVDGTASTLLAGWDPDQTWWLADVLQPDGPTEHWTTFQDLDEVLAGWHRVSG